MLELADGGDQHTIASEILHVVDSKTSLSKHSDDSQTRYQPAAPFSPFTVNKTQNLTFKIEACIRLLACWLRRGLTVWPGWPQTHLLPAIASARWDYRSLPPQPTTLAFNDKRSNRPTASCSPSRRRPRALRHV